MSLVRLLILSIFLMLMVVVPAFADSIADDYAIGAAVRATGLKVAIPPLIVAHACTE